ncbi:26S proteasome non-ATPase regulatory subunit 13 B [Sarracenia purpurea var. burkii]
MAALQYLDSLRNAHPELADWYNTLADLYQKKLWHQLTLKLEQFVALSVFQAESAVSSAGNSYWCICLLPNAFEEN